MLWLTLIEHNAIGGNLGRKAGAGRYYFNSIGTI